MTTLTMPDDLQTEPGTTAPTPEATQETSADPFDALHADAGSAVGVDQPGESGSPLADDGVPADDAPTEETPPVQICLLVDLIEPATNVNLLAGTILTPTHFDENDAACVIVEGSTYEDGELWVERNEFEYVEDSLAEALADATAKSMEIFDAATDAIADESPEPNSDPPKKAPLSTEELLLNWKADIERATRRVARASSVVDDLKERSKEAKKELEFAYDQLKSICERDPLQRSLFTAVVHAEPQAETETDDEPTDDQGQAEAADTDGEAAPFCESPNDAPTADDWRTVTLASIGLTAKQCEKLAEEGVVNMGQLADWQNGGGQLGDIKGFGEKAIDKMQSLFDAFWDKRNKQGS